MYKSTHNDSPCDYLYEIFVGLSLNALSFTEAPLGIVILLKFLQFLNAELPISLTVLGTVTDEREEQFRNE